MRTDSLLRAEEDASSVMAGHSHRKNWRAISMGVLIGLIVVMMLMMKWLVESQFEKATQRWAQEAEDRVAAARCFELSKNQSFGACLKAGQARRNLAE